MCGAPRSISVKSSARANGTSRASGSARRSPDRRPALARAVEAPRSRAGGHKVEEDEAVEDRPFAHVGCGPEALREMADEVGHGHFAGGDECGEAGEQAKRNKDAGEQLDRAR